MTMYFYTNKPKTPPFLAVPLFLMDEPYNQLSSEAKLLYGLMLRRVDLSRNTGWTDADGRVYQIFPIEEVTRVLSCCRQKAITILRELERCGLLERVKQGQGKASKLFLKIPPMPGKAVCETDSYQYDYETILNQNPLF